MEDLFRLRCRSSRISCCSVSNQKLLRVVHCRQPVLGIVLVTHLRLLMEALGCHVSVGIISECILFRQVPLTYGYLCHLVIRIIGVGVLPGFQITVELRFLCQGYVPGLIVFVGIRHFIKLALALLTLHQLAVCIVGKCPCYPCPLPYGHSPFRMRTGILSPFPKTRVPPCCRYTCSLR